MVKENAEKRQYYGENQNANFNLPVGFLGGGHEGVHEAGVSALFGNQGGMTGLMLFADNQNIMDMDPFTLANMDMHNMQFGNQNQNGYLDMLFRGLSGGLNGSPVGPAPLPLDFGKELGEPNLPLGFADVTPDAHPPVYQYNQNQFSMYDGGQEMIKHPALTNGQNFPQLPLEQDGGFSGRNGGFGGFNNTNNIGYASGNDMFPLNGMNPIYGPNRLPTDGSMGGFPGPRMPPQMNLMSQPSNTGFNPFNILGDPNENDI